MSIDPKIIEQAKKHLNTAGKVSLKVAKYGVVFTSGILVGTIAGVVLFFTINNEPI